MSGRILVISTSVQQNILCTFLNLDKDNKCKVLAIGEKGKSLSSDVVSRKVQPWSKKLFYPSDKQPEVLNVTFNEIQVICNKLLRVDDAVIIRDWKRMETM